MEAGVQGGVVIMGGFGVGVRGGGARGRGIRGWGLFMTVRKTSQDDKENQKK